MLEYIELALVIIGAASLIVAGLEKIAKITPNTKDDYYVGRAKYWLSWLSTALSKLALNPKGKK